MDEQQWADAVLDALRIAVDLVNSADETELWGEHYNPKLADIRFRQAIVRAIDASALVRAGYGSTAQVASGLIPLGVPGGPTVSCHARCSFDQPSARRLLAEVFPSGAVPPIGYRIVAAEQRGAKITMKKPARGGLIH